MLSISNGKTGWVSPVELCAIDAKAHTTGRYVLPVSSSGHFAKEYQVDIRKYSGRGEQATIETVSMICKYSQGKTFFVLSIAGHSIVFQECQGTRHQYIGQLRHPDFDLVLVEVEPVPSLHYNLDELFDDTGYILVGCDPWSNYNGIEQIKSSESED